MRPLKVPPEIVKFTNEKLNLADVCQWTFESGSTVAGVAKNNFAGDALVFDVEDLEGAWEMYSGAVDGFEKAASVTLAGQSAVWNGSAWASADYQLAVNEDQDGLVLSKLA